MWCEVVVCVVYVVEVLYMSYEGVVHVLWRCYVGVEVLSLMCCHDHVCPAVSVLVGGGRAPVAPPRLPPPTWRD